ncbi:MAG TPA: DUF1844 domain-containing protein [Candidatus Acidoferrales bacterium]|nr:DUF1844 domain-containing protein [Candidatus Acidoferrales bacterium]
MAQGEPKEEEKGFRVQDRRRFSESGEPREEQQAESKAETPPQGAQTEREPPPGQRASESPPPHAEINFSTFVISLSTQALVHLGEVPNPVSGQVERDLAGAKQMIDILGMLREKTRRNLDEGEEKLLDDALYDLRIRYVEAVRRS